MAVPWSGHGSSYGQSLKLRQDNSLLLLVLSTAVRVADLTGLVGLEKENLAEPLIGIDASRERSRVRYFERHETLPFRFKRGNVHNDSAACISRLAHTNRQHIPGNPEVFN